jgi:hypothetical protein
MMAGSIGTSPTKTAITNLSIIFTSLIDLNVPFGGEQVYCSPVSGSLASGAYGAPPPVKNLLKNS